MATRHDLPEPYVWNTEFAVNYEQLESEHVVLFELLLAVETDPTNQEKVNILQERMREHFYNEEGSSMTPSTFPGITVGSTRRNMSCSVGNYPR